MHVIVRKPSKSDAAAGDRDSAFQQHGSGTDRRGRTQAAREPLRVRPIAGRQAADSLGAGDQSSRYSSELRDTDQIAFDMLPRPGLQALVRHQIDGPAQQTREIALEIATGARRSMPAPLAARDA